MPMSNLRRLAQSSLPVQTFRKNILKTSKLFGPSGRSKHLSKIPVCTTCRFTLLIILSPVVSWCKALFFRFLISPIDGSRILAPEIDLRWNKAGRVVASLPIELVDKVLRIGISDIFVDIFTYRKPVREFIP